MFKPDIYSDFGSAFKNAVEGEALTPLCSISTTPFTFLTYSTVIRIPASGSSPSDLPRPNLILSRLQLLTTSTLLNIAGARLVRRGT